MNKSEENLWAGVSDAARNALTARDYKAGSLTQRIAHSGVDVAELAVADRSRPEIKRVWIPGVVSRETIVWAAEHRYPYIILNAPIEDSKKVWQLYDETAERVGYQAGSEQRGYLIRCHVAETEEKAQE